MTGLHELPKAELHLHIEGSLEPEMMFDLARRNGVALPYASVEAIRAAHAFANPQSFLGLYYAGAAVLCTERDFHDLTAAYVRRAMADEVRHAEIFFDPQTHTARSVPIAAAFAGIAGALREARVEHGFSSRMILCFLRHLSEADTFSTLEDALLLRAGYADLWIGVGLDSGEVGNPPKRFASVFARARELGFHAVAHAGERSAAGLRARRARRAESGAHRPRRKVRGRPGTGAPAGRGANAAYRVPLVQLQAARGRGLAPGCA
jgi:adenosine deaminase